jgi:phosphoribosylanthranilate isomerase
MVKVKICGITNLEDALMAAEAGADALGFNFYSKSPRYISFEKAKSIVRALPPFILKVGVFVNASRETIQEAIDLTGIDLIQLHGDETPEDCNGFQCGVIKAFRTNESIENAKTYSEITAILLDTPHRGSYGGTGQTFDWKEAMPFKKLSKSLILSGGLTPDNVLRAIEIVKPYGVDASSHLEVHPGKKDPARVKAFIQKVKFLDFKESVSL